MNYVKAPTPGRVVRYRGESLSDPDWFAEDVSADEYEGDYESLENYDAPGKPWDPTRFPKPTAAEKLAAAGLTVDELKELLGL
jgi:hypothetical protein